MLEVGHAVADRQHGLAIAHNPIAQPGLAAEKAPNRLSKFDETSYTFVAAFSGGAPRRALHRKEITLTFGIAARPAAANDLDASRAPARFREARLKSGAG
jgi:hypothetical protein